MREPTLTEASRVPGLGLGLGLGSLGLGLGLGLRSGLGLGLGLVACHLASGRSPSLAA